MSEYDEFVKNIGISFILENKESNPKSKDDILKLYNNVKFLRTFVNNYKISATLVEHNPNILMITMCILILRFNNKNNRYYVEMYISERVEIDDKYFFSKNYEFIKTILITKNYDNAFNFIINGVPIWPNRMETTILYPSFLIPIKKNKKENIIFENEKELIDLFSNNNKQPENNIKKLFNEKEARIYLNNNWYKIFNKTV